MGGTADPLTKPHTVNSNPWAGVPLTTSIAIVSSENFTEIYWETIVAKVEQSATSLRLTRSDSESRESILTLL
jgi:hypothetical protein